MNTDITLVAELELSDVELETVVGGHGSLIGAITIINDGINNTQNYTNTSGAATNNGTSNSSGWSANYGQGSVANGGDNVFAYKRISW